MKNLSLLFIAFLLLHFSSFAQDDWVVQNSGTTESLRGVCFSDANTGTIVGSSGTILRTTDGGNAWIPQQSGTTNQLYSVSFPDVNNGWVVGKNATILRTTNGGTTWTEQSTGFDHYLLSVCFTDVNNGTAVGVHHPSFGGGILRTTDGGTTWIDQTSGTTNELGDVSFIDANNGWVVGSYGTILRTTNGGTNWTLQSSGVTGNTGFTGVFFTDANNGWVVGSYGTILRTTNGGTNWALQSSGTMNGLVEVCFTDLNYGTAVGGAVGEATILRTTNGGTTWTEQSNGAPTSLSDVWYTDAFNGTVVGHYGAILRTRNGGGTFENTTITANALAGSQILEVNSTVGFSIGDDIIINPGGVNEEANKIIGFGSLMLETPLMFDHQAGEIIVNLIPTSIEDNRNNTPREYALYHNFPNPFNPTTIIKYQIPEISIVTVKVYDVLGNEIATLVNEKRPAGIYQIDFDASEYPSGIYFYRINAGDYTETKKMVLLK